tara:strand:- start:2548 stop:3891 length:1344 start_codon:yes stop_codon:yes gene_type:complete
MTIVNICSKEGGSYSPFKYADINLIGNDESNFLILKSSNIAHRYTPGKSIFEISRESKDISLELDNLIGHLMYEPGRTYPSVNYHDFSSFIMRVGDIHHLSNPLTSTFNFLKENNISSFHFNTTPHWISLFQKLGFNCGFWNRLSESAMFPHVNLNFSYSEKANQDLAIAYIGEHVAMTHPRRSWFVNHLMAYSKNINYYPRVTHQEWFTLLKNHHYIIAPTLNSQISHNLYTPCLLGAVVLTDQLACPSHLDDPLYPIIQFDSPRTLVDFCNLQPNILLDYWKSCFLESEKIRSLILDLDYTKGIHPSPDDYICSLSAAPSGTYIDKTYSELVVLNLIEIIQEMHRITKDCIIIKSSCASLSSLFSSVISLPRVITSSCTIPLKEKVVEIHSTTTKKPLKLSIDLSKVHFNSFYSSKILDMYMDYFSDFKKMNHWNQQVHCSISTN